MSQTAKSARDAMKAKAKRLASADPHTKVDSSTWSPAEPLNADIKTGMRPLSRRAFKKGGKVIGNAEGEKAKHRSDRAPRASGGKLDKYISAANKNQMKTMDSIDYENIDPKLVAKTRKREHGINLATSKIGGSKQKSYDDKGMFGTDAKKGMFKAKVPATDVSDDLKKQYKGRSYPMEEYTPLPARFARKEGGRATRYLTPDNLLNRDQKMANEVREGIKHVGGLKHGGKIKKFGGGDIVGDNPVSVQNRSMGKAAGVMKKGGRANYATDGKVDDVKAKKPINWSQAEEGYKAPAQENTGQDPNFRPASAESQEKLANLAKYGSMKGNPTKSPDYPDARKKGGKVKNWEGSKKDEAQDRMLAKKYGISMEKWEKSEKDKKHDKQQSMKGLKEGGRTAKYSGGGVFSGESYPGKVPGATGGRHAHAKGGKAGKGKTNINIVIASGPPKGEGMMPNAPVPAPKAMPVPPPAAGMPMMPPPGMAPAGGPPVPPPGMIPRKNGGRTIHVIDHAAGGGLGRLEKIKAYGLKSPK